MFKLFQEMQQDGHTVTARELYNRYFNIGPHKKVERMIIATFKEHNQECRALMGRDYELGTIKKYETVTRLLERFILCKTHFDMACIREEESRYVELPKIYSFQDQREKEIMLNRNFKRVNQEVEDMV